MKSSTAKKEPVVTAVLKPFTREGAKDKLQALKMDPAPPQSVLQQDDPLSPKGIFPIQSDASENYAVSQRIMEIPSADRKKLDLTHV